MRTSDLQPPAPVADEIRTFELVVNRAFGVAASERRDHAYRVADKFLEMVVGAATGDRATEAVRVTLAAQVRSPHPIGRNNVMDPRVYREPEPSALCADALEQFCVFARHRI